jgi:hypothetical protein
MDLLMWMHQDGQPYGYLARAGVAIEDSEAARICGLSLVVYRKLLEELGTRNVYSRDNQGRIYSRKLVRDHERYIRAVDDGNRGARSPYHISKKSRVITTHPIGSAIAPAKDPALTPEYKDKNNYSDPSPDVPRATLADIAARNAAREAMGFS